MFDFEILMKLFRGTIRGTGAEWSFDCCKKQCSERAPGGHILRAFILRVPSCSVKFHAGQDLTEEVELRLNQHHFIVLCRVQNLILGRERIRRDIAPV